MNKALKITLSLFIALILLIITTAIIVVAVFDPNEHKPRIISLFQQHTGRTLEIPGKLSLSLFPLSIQTESIIIGNAKGFKPAQFAKLDHFQLKLELLPLLKQQISADKIILDGLSINLVRDVTGKTNWDDLLATPTAANQSAAKPAPATALAGGLSLAGLEIHNAKLDWNDQQSKQHLEVNLKQLDLDQVSFDKPVNFKLSLDAKDHQGSEVTLQGKGQFSLANDLQQLNLAEAELAAQLTHPALKQAINPQLAIHNLAVQLDQQSLQFDALRLDIQGLSLNTKASIKHYASQPDLQGTLSAELKPRQLAALLGVDLQGMPEKSLQAISLNTELKGTLASLSAKPFKLQLDNSQLQGWLKLKLEPAMAVDYQLAIDQFNADDYVAQTTPDESQQAKQKSTTAAAALPLALLTQYPANGELTLGKLQVMDSHWRDIRVVSKGNGQVLQLAPISAKGYGTLLDARISIDTSMKTPKVGADFHMPSLQAGALLKDMLKKDKLSGTASVNASLTSEGVTEPQLRKALAGKADFKFDKGVIKGIDLGYEAEKLKARLKQQAEPAAPDNPQTEFAELTGTATIQNGVATNRDLRATLPFARVAGQGTVDLANENMDYITTLKFTSSGKVQGGRNFDDISNLPLDVRIHGPWEKLNISPDLSKALKAMAREKVDQKKEAVKQETRDKLEQKLKDKFKSLFK